MEEGTLEQISLFIPFSEIENMCQAWITGKGILPYQ